MFVCLDMEMFVKKVFSELVSSLCWHQLENSKKNAHPTSPLCCSPPGGSCHGGTSGVGFREPHEINDGIAGRGVDRQ
jgi:hypothetical protein